MFDMFMYVLMGLIVPLVCGLTFLALGGMEFANSRGVSLGFKPAWGEQMYWAYPPGYLPIAIVEVALGLFLLTVFTVGTVRAL